LAGKNVHYFQPARAIYLFQQARGFQGFIDWGEQKSSVFLVYREI